MNKTQLPFWGYTKLHLILWIIRYSEQKGSDGLCCYIKVWVYWKYCSVVFSIHLSKNVFLSIFIYKMDKEWKIIWNITFTFQVGVNNWTIFLKISVSLQFDYSSNLLMVCIKNRVKTREYQKMFQAPALISCK